MRGIAVGHHLSSEDELYAETMVAMSAILRAGTDVMQDDTPPDWRHL